MPDVQHDTALISQLEELLGFGQRGRNRFLDEHMHAGVKKFTGNFVVKHRGHRNTDHIDLPQEIAVIGKHHWCHRSPPAAECAEAQCRQSRPVPPVAVRRVLPHDTAPSDPPRRRPLAPDGRFLRLKYTVLLL